MSSVEQNRRSVSKAFSSVGDETVIYLSMNSYMI